jgi:hypothetical protein
MSEKHVRHENIRFRSRMRFLQECRICTKGTYYSYYGCIVCDACRTFFRRQVMLAALNKVSLLLSLLRQLKYV